MILIKEDFSGLFKNMTEMDFESLLDAANEFSKKNNYKKVIERVFSDCELYLLEKANDEIYDLERDVSDRNDRIFELEITMDRINQITKHCDDFKSMQEALNKIKDLSS